MNVKEFLKQTTRFYKSTFTNCIVEKTRPHIICKDGFSVSVQAGLFGSWYDTISVYHGLSGVGGVSFDAVELGFPSEADELILEYAEEPERPTKTVYGYVPIDVVEALITKHGGIDEEKTNIYPGTIREDGLEVYSDYSDIMYI